MFIDEPTRPIPNAFTGLLLPLVLAGALMLAGCDGTDVADDQIEDVVISPDSVSLTVGEQVDFSAVALTASGDTIRNVSFLWRSTDPAVFRVEDDGVATGRAPGTAYCAVGLPDDAFNRAAGFVGRDSAVVMIF